MERFCVNDLREKEVINVCDGRRLGYVYDVEIESCTGRVISIVVLFDCRMFGFGRCEELVIPWEKINCFGDDAILVSIENEVYEKIKCDAHPKKNKNIK